MAMGNYHRERGKDNVRRLPATALVITTLEVCFDPNLGYGGGAAMLPPSTNGLATEKDEAWRMLQLLNNGYRHQLEGGLSPSAPLQGGLSGGLSCDRRLLLSATIKSQLQRQQWLPRQHF